MSVTIPVAQTSPVEVRGVRPKLFDGEQVKSKNGELGWELDVLYQVPNRFTGELEEDLVKVSIYAPTAPRVGKGQQVHLSGFMAEARVSKGGSLGVYYTAKGIESGGSGAKGGGE